MSIIDVAISQEGTTENGLNNIKYNTWYYGKSVQGGSYPYCAVFVSWCAEQTGLSQQIIPRTASVTNMYNFFLEEKLFHKVEGYIPSPGDIMIQRAKGASHVGIVVFATAQGFYTIEGNAGAGVQRCFHTYTDPSISGFGKPKYPDAIVLGYTESHDEVTPIPVTKTVARAAMRTLAATTTLDSTTSTVSSQNPQMTEEEIWDYFRWRGYSAEATAGIMGRLRCETSGYNPKWEAIHAWNNTSSGGFGIFQLTWDDASAMVSNLELGRQLYPNSRLAKYLTWCETNNMEKESCISELEYMWQVDLDDQQASAYKGNVTSFRPEGMNGLTVAEAATAWTKGFERGVVSDEVTEGEIVYALYKDRPVHTGDTFNVAGTTATTTPTSVSSNTFSQPTVVNMEKGVGRYTYEKYTVVAGDTLESIAKKYNITPQLIMWANNLNSWAVTAGNTISIPKPSQVLSQSEAISGVGSLSQLTHSMKVEVSHPSVTVEFYGEYGKLAAKSTIVDDKNEHVDNDIISISTNRSIGQDCPTFVITLVWRNKWYDNLASNDMLIINMWRPPESKAVVMYGLVDDIRRTLDWSSGQPQRAVQVSGRGFNKTLCQFNIGMIENYSSVVSGGNPGYGDGFFQGLSELHDRNPAQCFEKVLSAYIGKALKFKFGNGKELKDYVEKQLESLDVHLIDYTSFTRFNGTMWNFLKELSNMPFEETYWEVVNNKPTIIHRVTPFEKANWIKLNRKTIYDYDLVSNNTGRSDYETFTIFNTNMALANQGANNSYPPVWYPPFYAKYGVKEYKTSSIFTFRDSPKPYDPTKYSLMLFNFYIKNNIFENGSLTVKGSNQYKIGERIILESEDMEYYVEGVSHTFNMYATWQTTLSVTRGLHPAERFTPPYGAAEDFTATVAMALRGLTSSGTIDWANLTEKSFTLQNYGGTNTASSINLNLKSGGSAVGVDGKWYSFDNKTWTHPAPECTIITSPFGWRIHPVTGKEKLHAGIDLACNGDAMGKPIVAAGDGIVVYAGAGDGYGNCIDIYHGNGYLTRYAHMYSDTIKVTKGQQVVAGQYIADIGNAGVGTGAHLHFELHTGASESAEGTATDPTQLFEFETQAPDTIQAQATDYSEFNTINTNSSMSEIAESCYNFLTSKAKLNKCAACAVLGVIQQLSKFNMTGKGLFQWSTLTELQAYCAAHNYEINSIAGQLGYFYEELQNTKTSSLTVLTNATNSRNKVYDKAIEFAESWGLDISSSCGTYAEDWWDELD